MNRRGRSRIWALAAASAVVMLLAVPAHAAGKVVHITKSDSAGNAVAGATFTLYVDAPPVGNGPPKGAEDTVAQGTCTTGANGQCDIADVPPGDYWVSETGPPPGYVAAPDSTLKVKRGKKKVFEVVVVDDKKPANTSVNDPTGDELAEDGTHRFQFGPSVAASPNGKQVLVAFNDSAGFFAGDESAIGYAFSTNRGRTFEDLGQIPTDGVDTLLFAQPTAVFDPTTGVFVVAAQGFRLLGQEFTHPILVTRYLPRSGEWSPLVDTFPALERSVARTHDPWLVVDTGDASPHAGTVYLGFTVSSNEGTQGFVVQSRNGGRTWSDPLAVTELGANDFLSPAVGPDGTLYASWTDVGGDAATTNDVYVARSTDGGRTFSRPFAIATDVPKSGVPTDCADTTRLAVLAGLVPADAPRIVADPADPGRLFATFTGGSGADPGDVFLSESRDGGRTWTPRVPVPGSAGTQMFPDIEATPDGRVGISYYSAASPGEIDFMFAFFDAFGPELGNAFHGVTAVTDEPFGLWNTNPGYDSFYSPCFGMQGNQMTAPGSGFFVSWTDGGDPGPAGNGGVDPNIDFARMDPALATTTTLTVSAGGSTIDAHGAVEPDPVVAARVTLTLFFDDGPGGFQRVDRERSLLGPGGTYRVSISSSGGTCRLVVRFDGSDGRLPSSATETFDC